MNSRKAGNVTRRNTIIKILIIALIALIAVVAVMGVLGAYGNRYNVNIDKIEVAYQDSGGIKTTNYVAVLNRDVVWDAGADREGIARYVINVVLEETAAREVRHFNILGQTADRRTAFLYSHEKGTILLYQDGKPTGEVSYG